MNRPLRSNLPVNTISNSMSTVVWRCAARAFALAPMTGAAVLLFALCSPVAVAGEPPKPTRPAVEPAAPTETAAPAVRTEQTGDGDDAVTVAAILAYAERHAPIIRVASTDLPRAQALLAAAEIAVPSNPMLSAATGPRLAGGTAALDVSLALSQEVFLGKKQPSARQAAVDELGAATARIALVRWRLHVSVHQLLHQALVNVAAVEQAAAILQFNASLREIVQLKVKAGAASPLMVLLADADVAAAKANVVEAQANERRTRIDIAAMSGWPTSEVPPLHGALPPVAAAPDLAVLSQRMEQRHPQLLARRAEVQAAASQRVAVERSVMPNLTLNAAYDREGAAGPGQSATNHIVTLGVSIPLVIMQKQQGQRGVAAANVARANANLDAQLMVLRGDLANAVLRMNAAAREVEIYEETMIPALNKYLEQLLRAFRVGDIDITAVSTTRERLLQASLRFNDARRRYFAARAVVEASVGDELNHQGAQP